MPQPPGGELPSGGPGAGGPKLWEMAAPSEEIWIRRLLEVGRSIVTELDLQTVLDRVLATAREITGARYAALGILNDRRTELSQFLTSGVDEETHLAIGDLPRGRGVLGVLIEEPAPLRLTDVGQHPRSYGFPTAHPVMRTFLGVPIAVRSEIWGNLYLAEKQSGEAFTDRDEEAAVILAEWAAVAIDNARLYETSQQRREELEKAVRGLEATRDVAVAIGGQIQLEPVLELIAKRGRALVGARSLVIMLRDGEELVVQASAGHVDEYFASTTRGYSNPNLTLEDVRDHLSTILDRTDAAPEPEAVDKPAVITPKPYQPTSGA